MTPQSASSINRPARLPPVILIAIPALVLVAGTPAAGFVPHLVAAGAAAAAFASWRRCRESRMEAEAARRIIDRLLQEQWLLIAETNRQLQFCAEREEVLRAAGGIATELISDYFAVYLPEVPEGPLVLVHETSRIPTGESAIGTGAPAGLARLASERRLELQDEVGPDFLRSSGLDSPRYKALAPGGFRSVAVAPVFAGEGRSGFALFAGTANGPQRISAAVLEAFMERISSALERTDLHEKLRARAESTQEMINIISHDIRNPVSVISLQLAFLDRTLRPDMDPSTLEKALGRIRQANEQVNRLLSHLLEVARLEAQGLELPLVPQCILPVLQEAVETIRPIAEERNIRMEMRTSGAGLTAPLNRDGFLQILLNLLGNAVKFSSAGGLVTLAVERSSDHIQFRVTDTGPGIPQEHIPRLFDRFWQATHHRRGSAGLGLAIVKKLVEAHRGFIRVESTPGTGSVFTVGIPEHR